MGMRGLDSSDSNSDPEDLEQDADIEIDLLQDGKSPRGGEPYRRKGMAKKQPEDSNQEKYETRRSELNERPGEIERFFTNSKKALKKTAGSFICLTVLMLVSFVISSYEYNHVHQ